MRMTGESARACFLAARVARLATVGADGRPHVVPVTFAVIAADAADTADAAPDAAAAADDGVAEEVADAVFDRPGVPDSVADEMGKAIVFGIDHKPKSTTALRRLENIAAEPRVSFLVDEYDEDWSRLWWARADAVARIVTASTQERALQALVGKYGQYAGRPPAGPVVAARVTRWSGWQARESPAPRTSEPGESAAR